MVDLTYDLLHELLEYRGGILYWKVSRSNNKIKAGDVAGCKNKVYGYVHVSINGKPFPAHRIVWKMHNKEDAELLDHINGIRWDNRIENLRAATANQNQHNRKLNKNNPSGIKGVCWSERHKKWKANVRHQGKLYYLGYFSDIKDADNAARTFRVANHGEFANHGG